MSQHLLIYRLLTEYNEAGSRVLHDQFRIAVGTDSGDIILVRLALRSITRISLHLKRVFGVNPKQVVPTETERANLS